MSAARTSDDSGEVSRSLGAVLLHSAVSHADGCFSHFVWHLRHATLILLHSEWLDWFGVHSWVTLSTMTRVEPGVRLNLFTVMPQNDSWITAFFWIFLCFAVLLTIGLWTRLSSVVVFVCLASMQQRNLYILHGGDVFLRVTGFFLMFAPAGAALSLDRSIRVRRKLEGPNTSRELRGRNE